MKIGIEVEGKHKGLPSFFVNETELDDLIKNTDQILSDHQKVRHLYVTSDNPSDEVFIKLSILVKSFYITLEVKEVNFEVPTDIHIMLNIDAPNVWKLKETDSVKFHNEQNYVLSTSLESLYLTYPEAFLDDEDINL